MLVKYRGSITAIYGIVPSYFSSSGSVLHGVEGSYNFSLTGSPTFRLIRKIYSTPACNDTALEAIKSVLDMSLACKTLAAPYTISFILQVPLLSLTCLW